MRFTLDFFFQIAILWPLTKQRTFYTNRQGSFCISLLNRGSTVLEWNIRKIWRKRDIHKGLWGFQVRLICSVQSLKEVVVSLKKIFIQKLGYGDPNKWNEISL